MAKRSSKRKRQGKKQRQQQQRTYMIGGIVIMVLAIVGGIIYSVVTAPPEVAEARLQQEAIMGSASAPVTLIEYGAYGCHACRGVHQSGQLQDIIDRYGDQIEFKFRNYPRLHVNDPKAAEAAQCALDQGDEAFWSYHDALFDISDGEYNTYTSDEDYVDLANRVGIDGGALETCLDERTHARTVDHWDDVGADANIPGTPTFFVNGQRLNSFTQIEAVIQQILG